MRIDYKEAAEFLAEHDNFIIIAHRNPDGDALGSAFSLCYVLRSLGKNANVACDDGFPERYRVTWNGYSPQDFDVQTVIAVDIADTTLFGDSLSHYADCVDLCIDHHISNKFFAERTLLNGSASAACEVLYEVYSELGITLNRQAAECVYTGMATDTGCFRYGNTTGRSHEIAAELFALGIDFTSINRRMFEIKSRARIEAEAIVLKNMEFYCGGKCAVIALTKQIMDDFGTDENEFDGLASLTVQVENVEVGVTIKQRGEDVYKLSLRSATAADVSEICTAFGGGGHKAAAGCTLHGTLDEVKHLIVSAVEAAISI